MFFLKSGYLLFSHLTKKRDSLLIDYVKKSCQVVLMSSKQRTSILAFYALSSLLDFANFLRIALNQILN